MSSDEKEFERVKEQFEATCKGLSITPQMSTSIIAYIQQQLNEHSFSGAINSAQYMQILGEAESGLFILVFINNYREGMDLIEYDPIYTASINYMRMLFSRVERGRDRDVKLAEIDAKKQNVIMSK